MALSNTRGMVAELRAAAHLSEDPNILTFVPAGNLGPIDIITICKQTGEHKYYDVKYASMRKTVKKTHNPMINRSLNKQQKKLAKLKQPIKIEIIYVYDNGTIRIRS
tara:strand:- start:15033 stop:15353 length:321 start_codon:yes stop_codon:yes gene_type:complete